MVEKEKERGRAIAQMPPPERNKLLARMMFGEDLQQAQMAMFMLMGHGVWLRARPPAGLPMVPARVAHHAALVASSRTLATERSMQT